MDAVIQEQLPIPEQVPVSHNHDGGDSRGQGSDLSQTLRKRVSQACQPCARRKTKCDGALPTCTQCKQRDIQECTYAQSRRNKRTRRSSPLAFQRPSLGYDDASQGGSPYTATERVDHAAQEYRFQQDGPRSGNQQGTPSNQGFAALDALAASATARRSNSIHVPLRQPPLANRNFPIVSRPTSVRLFKTYFSTIHPMWPILYKPMYDLTGLEYLPDTMSQPLLYAIYSIAACVQPLYDGSDDNYGDTPSPQHIFETALAALQQQGPLNLLKPSIENCQTLSILALQQHGVSEDTSAALLCSLAASMALELRIHRSMPLGSDPSEVQIRSRLWWSIFVLDKMMACEMGRPVHLRWEEQDNPFPSTSESDEFQLLSLRLAGQNRVSSVKTHTISGFHTTIQITLIIERISRQIYSIAGRESISERSKEAAETRLRLSQDLKDYGSMMDASPLKLDPNSSGVAAPVTITNIVWMWCLTILLHRPYINYHEPGDPSSPEPLLECVSAANNICHILEGYSDNLPMLSCDLIFPIFTTASTLSFWLRQDRSDEQEVRRQINLCIGWLRTLGKSWKNANSRQEMLAKDFKASPGLQSDPQTPDPRLLQNGGAHDIQQLPEDWTFLNGFGDPTDEFYVMDANFRDMLQVPGLNA